MNLNELQRKLTAAARAHAPSDRVPYAFEKRILSRLAAHPVPDSLALWAQALWRAALPCLAIVMLMGATSFLIPQDTTTTEAVIRPTTEFTQEFENTLLAVVDQNDSNEEGL